MSRLGVAAILLLALAPLATARPLVWSADAGFATQGSHEDWDNPSYMFIACTGNVVPVHLTLTITGGTPSDRLIVSIPDLETQEIHTAIASLGSPAVVDGHFASPCSGHFTVDALSVDAVTTYVWQVVYPPSI